MTKADFLQLLERALAQLPEEERRANLEYYSELLDDMLEEGMTEAEATAKLGSPSQIAQSILQEVPLGKLVSTRMKPKSGWTPLAIVLAVVGSPVWVPLLLLAARGERRLGVAALNAGADDFILPPLSMAEFVARARAGQTKRRLCRAGADVGRRDAGHAGI